MGNPAYEGNLAKVTILGGDWPEATWNVRKSGLASFSGGTIPADEFQSVTVVTEENRHRLGRTVGTAAVGALLIGPVGLLGGALFGKKQTITFLATLKQDRQVLCQTDAKGYQAIFRYTM